MTATFRALMIRQNGEKTTGAVEQVAESALPADGDVLVAVEYSSLNYKDGLCMTGGGRLVRDYPHIPGIDMAGTVLDSADARYKAGDKVILTGWRYGEIWWGGMAEKTRVKADWLVKLPASLTTRQAMMLGTAGLTAILGVMALRDGGVTKDNESEVLVTGAGGGVGSLAVMILARLGYKVAAVTGRMDEAADGLKALGASTILPRADFTQSSGKPMESGRWAGCIESVGGATLARVIGQMGYNGTIASIGNAGGVKVETNVLPFILRGVQLIGIDSVMQPFEKRMRCWEQAAEWIDFDGLESVITEAGLDDAFGLGNHILAGRIRGRVVINLAK